MAKKSCIWSALLPLAAILGADHAAAVEKSHEDGSQSGLRHVFFHNQTVLYHPYGIFTYPIPSMYPYMNAWFFGFHVDKYTYRPMDPMGTHLQQISAIHVGPFSIHLRSVQIKHTAEKIKLHLFWPSEVESLSNLSHM